MTYKQLVYVNKHRAIWFTKHAADQACCYATNFPLNLNLKNSLRLGDTCQLTGEPSLQVMAHQLFRAKPLPKPAAKYHQLHRQGHISMKFHLNFKGFHWRLCIWKWSHKKSPISFRPQWTIEPVLTYQWTHKRYLIPHPWGRGTERLLCLYRWICARKT